MQITIKRPKSKLYDESKFRIYVNRNKVATLQENQSQEIEIEESLITIEARFNWVASKKLNLNVNDGDIIEFLPNMIFSKMGIILPSLIVILYMLAANLETLWLKWSFGALLAVDLLLILYVLVIARRKWIYVNHIKQK
ncbi:MAG: hypothetical protein PHD00_09910 [Bacteroidales bacterium]|nr:hypothetical protein [Bacteroidales bacterium]MDD4673588.1 hypothetical protein [Bacteroidales bacterium]